MEASKSEFIEGLLSEISDVRQRQTDTRMQIAARIEDAMLAKGWNRSRLVKETGSSNPSLATKWLSGTHNFQIDTLVAISHALGIHMAELLEDKEDVVQRYSTKVTSNSTFHFDDSKKAAITFLVLNQAYISKAERR